MAFFAVLHIWAFSYRPYKPAVDAETAKAVRTPMLPALLHVLNFRASMRNSPD